MTNKWESVILKYVANHYPIITSTQLVPRLRDQHNSSSDHRINTLINHLIFGKSSVFLPPSRVCGTKTPYLTKSYLYFKCISTYLMYLHISTSSLSLNPKY